MKYSISTINNTFKSGLSLHFCRQGWSHINWDLWTPSLNRTCAALLMKFDHVEYKVTPVLNIHLNKMLAVNNLNDESDCKRLAEVMQTRYQSHRNISWISANIGDIEFFKRITTSGQIIIDLSFLLKKIKGMLIKIEKRMLNGLPEWAMCFNMILLFYLANHRKIFYAGDAISCILANNFTIIVYNYFKFTYYILGREKK
jgi:hypothetical protein